MILVEIPSKTHKLNEDILVRKTELLEPTINDSNDNVVDLTDALQNYPLIFDKIKGYTELDYDGIGNSGGVTNDLMLKVIGKTLGKNLYYKDLAYPRTRYKIDETSHKLVYDAKSYCTTIECEKNTTYTVQKTGGNVFKLGYTYEHPRYSAVQVYGYTGDDSASYNTITTDDNAKYLVIYLYYASGSYKTSEINAILETLMIEKGDTPSSYEPCNIENESQLLSFGDIELCDVHQGDNPPTYEDYIHKVDGVWYTHKEVEKIESYNGETITTDYMSSTGSLTTGATVFYGVDASEQEITDSTLISQLNNLDNFVTYSKLTKLYTTVLTGYIHPTFLLKYYTKDDVLFTSDIVDTIDGYVDNKEAMKQAIYHILRTERYDYLIYSNNYGVELRQYIGESFEYLRNTIEQTLRDALTYDLRIKDVVVNKVEQKDSDKAVVNFTAYTIYGDLQLEVSVVV